MYDIKSQKILGSFDPIDGVWSIPYEFDPDDINVLNSRGRLYMVLDFEGSSNIDLHLASKILIDETKEKYYGDSDGTPLQALEKALISGKDKLKEIAKTNDSSVKSLNFNVACAVVWGKVLYVAQLGESAVLLVRNGEVLDIGHKTSGEVLTSSGILESDDVFILSTKKFNDSFNNSLLLEKLGSLEEEFKKSDSPASFSAVVVMFKKSMLPNKRDIVGIVSSLSKRSAKIDVDTSTHLNENLDLNSPEENVEKVLENDPDLSSITSLTDIPSSANQETGVSSVLATERNTKKDFKKPNKKTLMVAGFGLIATGILVGSYFFIPKINLFKKDAVTIATLDVSEFNLKFENLVSNNADKQEYEVLLSDLNKEIENGNSDTDLQVLKVKIENSINKFDSNSDSSIFNFKVKSDSSAISSLSAFNNDILISDRGAKQSYVFTDEEPFKIADLPKNDNYLITLSSEDNLYILTTKAVFIGPNSSNLAEFSLDTEIANFTGAVEYLGNIYVLANGSIYKYIKGDGTFTRSIWAENVGNFNDLAIDGSIYLVGNEGVTEYYVSEEQEFNTNITNAVGVYTNRDLDYLWILLDKKLVKVDKKSGEELTTVDLNFSAQHFTVLEDSAFLSSGSKLYKIDLAK